MIDLTRYPDHVILKTAEVRDWTGRSMRAILDSRLPRLPKGAKSQLFVAGDVKRWILEGNAAFPAPTAEIQPPPQVLRLSAHR